MSIHQDVHFDASPDAIYDLLTNSKKFAAMTGDMPAEISREVGGAATMFGGHISARNIELSPGKRVVQSWRAQTWPEGVHSIVRFELVAQGKGTQVIFDQVGHPAADQEHLTSGWNERYWAPMRAMLAGK